MEYKLNKCRVCLKMKEAKDLQSIFEETIERIFLISGIKVEVILIPLNEQIVV
jgi:hypothetical protein